MKIAIMSDSHDQWNNLKAAIKIAEEKNCKEIWFAGDLIAPTGILILRNFKGTVRLVLGNNEGELLGIADQISKAENIDMQAPERTQVARGMVYEHEINGVKIFMNHYPKIAQLAAKSGEYDVVVYGHDHTYHESTIKNTQLLNPGALTYTSNGPSSFMIFDTNDRSVEKIIL